MNKTGAVAAAKSVASPGIPDQSRRSRRKMNWKLIFGLSLFGLAMGIGTVFAISPRVEPLCWLVIFVISAFVIARRVPLRAFLHGFLLGIVNGVWVTAAHVVFYNRYLATHAMESQMIAALHGTRIVASVPMVLIGLASGLISGVVIGVVAYAVARSLASSGPREGGRGQKARLKAL